MTVRLIHGTVGSGHRLMHLPKWHVPSAGKYRHIPRSAELLDDARVRALFWCGQSRTVSSVSSFSDADHPGDLKCGTCLGRHLGHLQHDGMIFSPLSVMALPKICPGGDWITHGSNDRACSACTRRVNWGSRDAAGFARSTGRHAPSRALGELHMPCYRHGWTRMHEPYHSPGVLWCSGHDCDHVSMRLDLEFESADA